MILVLVGGTVFAQTEASYSGEATLSWGIDLGNGKDKDGDAKIAHGFKNEGSATVTLPFVKKGSSKTFGEGDIYAFLNISGVKLGLQADMAGAKTYGLIEGLEAKIVIKKFYVTVYEAPDMTTSYAHRIIARSDKFNNGFGGYGTKIGYADDDMYGLDVGVKFVSNGSWEERGSKEKKETKTVVKKNSERTVYGVLTGGKYRYTGITPDEKLKDVSGKTVTLDPNGDCDHLLLIAYKEEQVDTITPAVPAMNGHYGFGIDFSMEPVKDYLKIDAGFNMTFDKKAKYQKDIAAIAWDDSSIINFGTKLTSKLLNKELTLTLGFDGGTNYKWTKANGDKADEFAWALGFGAKYSKPIVGTIDAGLYVASESTPYGRNSVFKLKPDTEGGVDMAMAVGYKGLFLEKNLDVHARLTANHLFSKINEDDAKNNKIIPMTFNFGASYKFDKLAGKDYMWVKPYGDIWGESNFKDYEDYTDAQKKYFVGLAYKLGVEFQPMEHLVVDAAWAHGKRDKYDNITHSMNHNAHNGTFILSATISY